MKLAALILAGGQGTRFGGVDKALLALEGAPLLALVLARLRPQVEHIAISANGDAARFQAYGVPVLADELVGRGPLAGVVAGLEWAAQQGVEFLATVPVDTPFFPEDLVARLLPGPSVAAYKGRQHHLVALWPVAFRAELGAFLRAPGAYKVRDALALCRARQVAFQGSNDPFLNINTEEDLKEALLFL